MSMAGPGREADGSEFLTDGNRLVRARNGNGAGCRFTPRPVFAGPGAVSRFLDRPHYGRTKSESQELLPNFFAAGGLLELSSSEIFCGRRTCEAPDGGHRRMSPLGKIVFKRMVVGW